MAEKDRHVCSYCNKKRYEDKMIEIYYPLVHKRAWHCIPCFFKFETLYIPTTRLSPRVDNKENK